MTRNDLLTLAQRLREYNHNPHHINPTSEAFHNLIAESASAISMLATPPADAADMGGQAGEEVEVVAWRHFGDASRLLCDLGKQRSVPGDYAAEFNIPLMTVAQHQRILAAISAQQSAPDRVSVPVELLERAVGNGLGSSIKAIGELRVLLEGWKV